MVTDPSGGLKDALHRSCAECMFNRGSSSCLAPQLFFQLTPKGAWYRLSILECLFLVKHLHVKTLKPCFLTSWPYLYTPPIILDFQQPVSLRLARDISGHIIRFSGVSLKCATPDSGYSTFLVVTVHPQIWHKLAVNAYLQER